MFGKRSLSLGFLIAMAFGRIAFNLFYELVYVFVNGLHQISTKYSRIDGYGLTLRSSGLWICGLSYPRSGFFFTLLIFFNQQIPVSISLSFAILSILKLQL